MLTLKFRQVYWNWLAIREFGRRVPDALAYRRACSALIAKKPGECFFTEKSFQKHKESSSPASAKVSSAHSEAQ
jgi:hypothetical protein